jgi:gas vesicle protein
MQERYVTETSENSITDAFWAGVIVGIVAGLMLTPQAGAELREIVKDYTAKALDDIMETSTRAARTYVDVIVQRGKDYIESSVENALEPVKNVGLLH